MKNIISFIPLDSEAENTVVLFIPKEKDQKFFEKLINFFIKNLNINLTSKKNISNLYIT